MAYEIHSSRDYAFRIRDACLVYDSFLEAIDMRKGASFTPSFLERTTPG